MLALFLFLGGLCVVAVLALIAVTAWGFIEGLCLLARVFQPKG